MALALSQSQSGTTASPCYMSISLSSMSSSSSSAAYWPDADASAFNSSPGVPGGGSSNTMPYSATPHSSASASALYSAHTHHQGMDPSAHNSYAGYSAHAQDHPTSYHNASYPQSNSSQAQVQQRASSGTTTAGMRHSPATSSPSSSGSSSSSSLQYALRPHAHSHAHHSSLSAALASTTTPSNGGHASVSSSSPFSSSPGSGGSSGPSGSSSLVSSLALSTLSPNANSNASVSPVSPHNPHTHHLHHPHHHYGNSHTYSQQTQAQSQTQQFQNNHSHSHSHSRNQNQTPYVHSHAYPVQGSTNTSTSAGSGSGNYVPSGSSAPVYNHSSSAGPNPNSSSSGSNNSNPSAIGMNAQSTAANMDIHSHGGMYTFDDSPEPPNHYFETGYGAGASGASGSPPGGATHKTAHAHSHSNPNSHAYPRLQIPTNAQSGYTGHNYAHGHGIGQAYSPVSPHVQSRGGATPSAYSLAVNGYGNDTPTSEISGIYTRERSGTRASVGVSGLGGGLGLRESRIARVKTEPDLEESRSLERSPDLSHSTTTPFNEGGVCGSGGGDGGGGARFVMEHPYPYTYATRPSQRMKDERDRSSFSPPLPSSVAPANGMGASYSSSPSANALSPKRHGKHEPQQPQMQVTPHSLTAPLRAVNASAEMRKCMGVFRLDPFAQLNGVALRCGFVSSSFDEATWKKSGSGKSKNKSKGKKGGKKRGRGRKTRKNVMAESDDEDAMASDLTDDEQDEGENSDDNTPTWDGLPAGPLAEEPVLIEFQLYFDGMEVEGEDDSFEAADDAEEMKVLDSKWGGQGRREDDLDEMDQEDYGFDGTRNLKYGRSRAYSYSATAIAAAADREKGMTSTVSGDSRRYRANEDRYNSSAEYSNNNSSSNNNGNGNMSITRCESESQDRKLSVIIASSRSHYYPMHSQTQERASAAATTPPRPVSTTSRTYSMLEDYLDLDLGDMDDINMDMNATTAATTAASSNEMDGWASGGTSPSTPYALTQSDNVTAGRGNPFTMTLAAQAQAQTSRMDSTSSSARLTIFTGATGTDNNSVNSSSAESGVGSSLNPNAVNSNSYPSTTASAPASSPIVPSSYANEYTNSGQVRTRYIDPVGYMRLSETTQLPSSSSSSFLSGHSTPSTSASTSGNANSVPSSTPSPFYGVASGPAGGASNTDNNVTLQQLRTQAALRAVSAHAAQTQSQGLHGLYRASSETVSGNALAHVHAHRLSGASASAGAGAGVGAGTGTGSGVSSGGSSVGGGAMGHALGSESAFRPTPASLAAEMQTGLLASGRPGGSATKPSLVQGQGQTGSAYNAYPQPHSESLSTAAYPDYGSVDGFSGSGTFGQSHGYTQAHSHAHGANQSGQTAFERRWSDSLQRVHG